MSLYAASYDSADLRTCYGGILLPDGFNLPTVSSCPGEDGCCDRWLCEIDYRPWGNASLSVALIECLLSTVSVVESDAACRNVDHKRVA